jgi:hypothetical protein
LTSVRERELIYETSSEVSETESELETDGGSVYSEEDESTDPEEYVSHVRALRECGSKCNT